MEAARHLLPTEIHHGHEGTLHEEGYNTLDSQWSAKDVAHEPGVVAPVGAEFKLKDNASSYAQRKVDSE